MTIRSKVPSQKFRDNYDQIEWNHEYEDTGKSSGKGFEGHYVQGEIEPFVSHVDGTLIKSRKQLREHMQRHDLVNYNDGGHAHQQRVKERGMRMRGEHPDQKRERIQQLRDAYEKERDARYARERR